MKITNSKYADISIGYIISFTLQLMESLVDQEQHIGTNHRDLINDEQLQIGQLCSESIELVLCERLGAKL